MAASNLPVEAKDILWQVSEDNTDWYTVECLESQGYDASVPTTERNTQCENFTGTGNPVMEFPVEGVANITPDAVVANLGTASVKQLHEWFQAQTRLYFRRRIYDDAGTPNMVYGLTGRCKITNYSETLPVGDKMGFSATFKADSGVTITP